MKKTIFLLAGLFLSIGIMAQNLDEILEAHFEVVGQDKIEQLESMVLKGHSMQMGTETPFELIIKRPDKMRIEIDIQGQKIIQAYDGEKGWVIQPFGGSKDPIEVTGAQLSGMKTMADMDGPLYNWEDKGYEAKLIGEEDMEGSPVYKIEVVMDDDMTTYYYIDKENHVILKDEISVVMQGQEVNQENYYSNYKPYKGVIMSYEQETKLNGQVFRQSVIDSVEFDRKVDDSIFEMPEKETVEEKKNGYGGFSG